VFAPKKIKLDKVADLKLCGVPLSRRPPITVFTVEKQRNGHFAVSNPLTISFGFLFQNGHDTSCLHRYLHWDLQK
jgi:hypothetical protein